MQNIADKTFGSAEINHKSISDDGNKNKCPHEIEILNDKVQSLEMEKSFLENEIHDVKSSLNTITVSLSCKSRTTETANTLYEKSYCQEAFNELGNVYHCTDNLQILMQ